MKKTYLFSLVVFSVILVALSTLSVTSLPDQAKAGERTLQKITFIHFKNANAKPPWAGGKDKGTACYSFLAKGVKWKETEPYYVNPTNEDDMSDSFVSSAVNSGASEWETYGGDIFGNGHVSYSHSYNNGNLDGVNTASFGYYPNSNVIAVTTVWGYWSGPPKYREIVEWDILFNEYYDWGNADVDSSKMDLQNIATHELGHSAGLADLYQSSCIEETMYGYSDYGETSKRDLASGDIAGIEDLYL